MKRLKRSIATAYLMLLWLAAIVWSWFDKDVELP